MRLSSLDNDDFPLYTIGQVASLLGVPTAYLRRLDSESVVAPARTPGGQRRYSRGQIGEVERVMQLAGEGLTLTGIVRIVALEAEVTRLRRQIADMEAAQSESSGAVPPQ